MKLTISLGCRHCLWVLGNAATLRGSGSVWTQLIQDAEDRRCFFDWGDGMVVVSPPVTLPPPPVAPVRSDAKKKMIVQLLRALGHSCGEA